MTFTLPRLTQEQFTKWFGKLIPNTNETIVYPGKQLPCMTKTSSLKNNLKPEHVFITHDKNTDKFFHRVLGDDGTFALLPKRMHATVYPNISFNTIPTDNRIKVKLSNRRTVELPYIPDSFFEQKKKSCRRSVTRPKRQREETPTETVRRKKAYRGWTPSGETTVMKKQYLLAKIKAVIDKIDDDEIPVMPPLHGSELSATEEEQFATICKFVHFYAREELGMVPRARAAGDVNQSIIESITSK